jgi:hypothetical protein
VRRLLRNRYAVVLGLLALAVGAWNAYVAAHDDGIVEGRVVGPDGAPVAGVTVTLRERTLTTLEPRATTRTGRDGSFRFAGQRGHHIELEAAREGGSPSLRVVYRLAFRGQNLRLAGPLRLGP